MATELPAIAAGSLDADAAVVHAATGAQRRRLVTLRAEGTIGDAAFQRLEAELDRMDLGWAQVLPHHRATRKTQPSIPTKPRIDADLRQEAATR